MESEELGIKFRNSERNFTELNRRVNEVSHLSMWKIFWSIATNESASAYGIVRFVGNGTVTAKNPVFNTPPGFQHFL